MHESTTKRRWLAFLLGLMTIAGFIIVAHVVSPSLPGTSGAVYQQNVAENIDATALFYTDLGSLHDYLSSDGKYAAATAEHGR